MILVTGGCGFIGGHLVQRLIDSGNRVRVFDLPTANFGRWSADRIEAVRGDIRDREQVARAVEGCKHVYHLAGNPNLWTRHRQDFYDTNHLGTRHVLEAAVDSGAERILYASTESILGTTGEETSAMEFVRPNIEHMIGDYCKSKLLGEQEAFRLADAGKPVIIAAPTLPVGPNDESRTPPTRMTISFCRGELPAIVECRLNLIDVRDIAIGLVHALERGVTGKRYLLGYRNMLLSEWLGVVGNIIGRKVPRFRVPYFFALGVGWISERCADWFTGRIPNATVTGVRLTQRNLHFDPTATHKELGLTPRPIEESARDAVAWYREKSWI